MRSVHLSVVLFWLQCVLLVNALELPSFVETPPVSGASSGGTFGKGSSSDGSTGYGFSGDSSSGPPPRLINPGESPQGTNPTVPTNDEKVDISKVGENLKDLSEKINTLANILTSTSTTTTTVTSTVTDDSGNAVTTTTTTATILATITTTPTLIPIIASACEAAQSAFATCSSAHTNFTSLARTQQAGCLCSAVDTSDFNSDMKGCYYWVQGLSNATQLQRYASEIANATALCPSDGGASTTATTTAAPSVTPGSNGPVSGGSRGWEDGRELSLVWLMAGFSLMLLFIGMI